MEIDLIEIDEVMRVIQFQERVNVSALQDLSWRSNEGILPVKSCMTYIGVKYIDRIASS